MKVSVITAVFNASDTIVESITSVLNQSHDDIELIVIDGASTDGTCELLEQFGPRLSLLVSEPDSGIYDAMNKGINRASGEVIGFLNGDDIYSNINVLSNVMEIFSNNNIDACYGDLQYVEQRNESKVTRNWISGGYNHKKYYWGWMPPHPTFFVRRSIYDQHGGFDLTLGSSADYELMLRFLLKHRINVAYIPQVLVKMRSGGVSNASIGNRLKANLMDRKAWRVNGLTPYPWTLWMKPLRKISQWFVKI